VRRISFDSGTVADGDVREDNATPLRLGNQETRFGTVIATCVDGSMTAQLTTVIRCDVSFQEHRKTESSSTYVVCAFGEAVRESPKRDSNNGCCPWSATNAMY
jgi:hypothetical protein